MAAAGALLAVAAGVPALAGVTPSVVVATKNPGHSFNVNKVVATPAIPPRPDIVFLADTTGKHG